MSKYGRKIKQAPEGFEYVEPILTALDNELREKVNEPHEGLRKTESQWPVHQINWQKSRYIYDLYYTYEKISREVYDHCITNKIVDAALIAKWKKTGYERLCSTYTINPRNYKFGTVSICRVPKQYLAPGTEIEDPITGCRGCASGNGGNIFGNKYGQYLAAIQVAREERKQQQLDQLNKQQQDDDEEGEGENEETNNHDKKEIKRKREKNSSSSSNDNNANQKEEEEEEDNGPVGAADGSSGKKPSIWAKEDEHVELSDDLFGTLDFDAEKEARVAAKAAAAGKMSHYQDNSGSGGGQYYKKSRH